MLMVLSKGERRIQICINHIFSPALKKKQSKGNIRNIKRVYVWVRAGREIGK